MQDIFGNTAVVPLLGFAVGIVGTIIGAGGGFFVIPYLLLVFDFDPPALASGTSLWVVLANSVSATLRNVQVPGRIEYRLGWILAAFTIPGAILGSEIVQGFRSGAYQISFAGLLVAAAVYAVIVTPRGTEAPARRRWHYVAAALVSVATGLIAAIFGVGGGVVHVPLMMFAFGMPALLSTSTSQFALVFTSAAGALAFWAKGQVDWRMVLLLAPGVVLGSQVGVWAAARISQVTVRRVLAVVFLVVAVELVLKSGIWNL
jgi:uncharacterized membrane protein YfcA